MAPLPIVPLPRVMPARPERPVQSNIPPTPAERERLRTLARQYAEQTELVPPLPLAELQVHAGELCRREGLDPVYTEVTALLINNELWRETLATIPYERRLLLLPKCMRVEEHCPAPFDELGLLCKKCGLCSIEDLQVEAEKMGYAVLVAEGSPIVMAIIETGRIDAIVGVSCLNVLERVYGYMEAAAVPGIAIPLLQDDCVDVNVDLDWIWETVHLTSDDQTRRLDLGALREQVDGWFNDETLSEIMGPAETTTEQLGRAYLAAAGKRWRPFLAVALHQALQDDPSCEIVDTIRTVAVAVECFHKASLIHDDIEDGDALRDGSDTLHEREGVPIALNVGDYLVGEGYRLLAEVEVDAERRAEMLALAAAGHRTLCLGQGDDLAWAHAPKPIRATEVVAIFRRKTAPAFETALRLGAACAGAPATLHETLTAYSDALGIAYQIRDDLGELHETREAGEAPERRPTLVWALAHEAAKRADRKHIAALWTGDATEDPMAIHQRIVELGAESRAQELLTAYEDEAIRSLRELDNANVKGLLRRVLGKIFDELTIEGWCSEHEARNAAGREASLAAAG
ncbi:MAG: polyprenyl synthetase family protein [Acidobacteriota bacterium]